MESFADFLQLRRHVPEERIRAIVPAVLVGADVVDVGAWVDFLREVAGGLQAVGVVAVAQAVPDD